MKQTKSRKLSHYACSDCAVKFTKYYFSCPFCSKLITANVPFYVAGFIGTFGVLLAATLFTISRL